MKNTISYKPLFLLCLVILLIGCDKASEPDDKEPRNPTVNIVDPLESFYNTWLTECLDFGGGQYVQLFANPKSNGELKLGLLQWNEVNCEGTYSLSDFDGNHLTSPSHLIDFELQEVSNIPDDFFVLKSTTLSDSSVTYGIFYIKDKEFYNLSDYAVFHDKWSDWLLEDDVQGYVDDPANYIPISKQKLHFNQSELPDPLQDLHGNWLSDCVDLGGGAFNQFFSTFSADGPKGAVLTWDTVGCSGNYTLTDNNGNPITEPVHTQDVVSGYVSGLPVGFFVAQVTNLIDDSILYAVIALNPAHDEFYELVPYAGSHETWTNWLLEDEVSDFEADPVGFTPATHLKLHFIQSDLP